MTEAAADLPSDEWGRHEEIKHKFALGLNWADWQTDYIYAYHKLERRHHFARRMGTIYNKWAMAQYTSVDNIIRFIFQLIDSSFPEIWINPAQPPLRVRSSYIIRGLRDIGRDVSVQNIPLIIPHHPAQGNAGLTVLFLWPNPRVSKSITSNSLQLKIWIPIILSITSLNISMKKTLY